MPPKRRGYVAYGKARVFRHAVQHVHVGRGHAVLGSLSLQLAVDRDVLSDASLVTAMCGNGVDAVSVTQSPAFLVELNWLLQSCCARDYKQFRWSVLDWCASKPLFALHHQQIAERLIGCLLRRAGGHDGSDGDKSLRQSSSGARRDDEDDEDADESGGGDALRGSTTEGFEAFARLTIAFARDLQADFLRYFDVFQRALTAGMYDRAGALIVDAQRVQLVFAVQVAWCREMRRHWCSPSHEALVRRIVRTYVVQLHDSKEYVRRLTAELLAYVARLRPALLRLMVADACAMLLDDFTAQQPQCACAQHAAAHASLAAADDDEDNDEDEDGASAAVGVSTDDGDDGDAHTSRTTVVSSRASRSCCWRMADVARFVAATASSSRLVHSLTLLCAELLRGMRGAVSLTLESSYASLLRCFLLLDEASDDDDGGGVARKDCHYNDGHDDDDGDAHASSAVDEKSTTTTTTIATTHLSPSRWRCVLCNDDDDDDECMSCAVPSSSSSQAAVARGEAAAAPTHVCVRGAARDVAREVVRGIGSCVVGDALALVLHETTTAAAALARRVSNGDTYEAADDDDDADGGAVVAAKRSSRSSKNGNRNGSRDADTDAQSTSSPPLRLLRAVLSQLQAQSSHHVRLLDALLTASQDALWRNVHSASLLQRVATLLLRGMQASSNNNNNNDNNNSEHADDTTTATACAAPADIDDDDEAARDVRAQRRVDLVAAVLELLLPLCLQPGSDAHAMAMQRTFASLARTTVAAAVRDASLVASPHEQHDDDNDAVCVTPRMRDVCFAFAQDVLQKHYACCLAVEEAAAAAADEQRSRNSSKRSSNDDDDNDDSTAVRVRTTPSMLTPLALTLLHRIAVDATSCACRVTCNSSNNNNNDDDDDDVCERVVLLLRLANERNAGMLRSPLQQLLRVHAPSRAVQSSSLSSSSSRVHAGAELQAAVSRLLHALLAHFASAYTTLVCSTSATTTTTATSLARCAERLSCALPVLQTMLCREAETCAAHTTTRTRAGTTRDTFTTTVTTTAAATTATQSLYAEVMCVMRATQHVARTHDDDAQSHVDKAADDVHVVTYAMYAQLAALLLRVPALSSTLSTSVTRHHGDNDNNDSDNKAADGDNETDAVVREVSVPYLVASIRMLASGLASGVGDNGRDKNDGDDDNSGDDDDDEDTTAAMTQLVRVHRTEQTRLRLFRAAAVLLSSLCGSHDDNDNDDDCDDGDDDGDRKDTHDARDAATTTAQASTPSPSPLWWRAMLRALPAAQRTQLLDTILPECLAAPLPHVRLLALRLLLYTAQHDAYTRNNNNNNNNNTTDATTTTRLSDVALLRALRTAEQYNPLQPTGAGGRVDALRHALAPVQFAVDAHVVTSHTTRLLLARAAVGLLYRKYAPAWAAAVRLLTSLVRDEATTRPTHGDDDGSNNGDSDSDSDSDSSDDDKHSDRDARVTRLTPVVWRHVVRRYAPLLTLGGASVVDTTSSRNNNKDNNSNNDNNNDDDDDDDAAMTPPSPLPLPCAYRLRPSAQQQQLVERITLHSARVASDAVPLALVCVTSPLCWRRDWRDAAHGARVDVAAHVSSSSSSASHNAHDVSAAAAAARVCTDSDTVARTFLSALSDMLHSTRSAAHDDKTRLAEQLVRQLAALHRGGGGGEVARTTLRGKRLEDRLVAAMQTLCAAPPPPPQALSSSSSSSSSSVLRLTRLFASYVTDGSSSARVQRGALDNLRRLRVAPYAHYHAALAPYTDTHTALFAFLSTFDLARDVAAHDRAAYVSAALSLALPKLLARVSRDGLKQQAVLRRRLMSMVAQLSHDAPPPHDNDDDDEEAHGRVVALTPGLPSKHDDNDDDDDDAAQHGIVLVFRQLLHQLVLSHVPTHTNNDSDDDDDVRRLDFLHTWQHWANASRHAQRQPQGNVVAVSNRNNNNNSSSVRHAALRRLGKLVTRLSHAMQLLDALLHALGTQMRAVVRPCLHASMQAYLLACKEQLLQYAVCDNDNNNDNNSEGDDASARRAAWSRALSGGQALSSSSLAQLRRASVTVVLSLFEHLPDDVYAAVRRDVHDTATRLLQQQQQQQQQQPQQQDDASRVLHASLLGRFVRALAAHTRGVVVVAHADTLSAQASTRSLTRRASTVGGHNNSSNNNNNPMLRLLRAWLNSPALLPCVPAFADDVAQALTDVFAVRTDNNNSRGRHGGGGSGGADDDGVLRASSAALCEGLQCVTDMLRICDETFVPLYARAAKATTTATTSTRARTKTKTKTVTTTTLRASFLQSHVVYIFAALYRLAVRGAGADGDDDNDNDDDTTAVVTQRQDNTKDNDDDDDDDGDDDGSEDDDTHAAARTTHTTRSVASARVRTTRLTTTTTLSLSLPTWKTLIQTIALLARHVTSSEHGNEDATTTTTTREHVATTTTTTAHVQTMLSRLLEVTLRFVTHPACAADAATVQLAASVVRDVTAQLHAVDYTRHVRPLTSLFNVVTHPRARLLLCATLHDMAGKLPLHALAPPCLCATTPHKYNNNNNNNNNDSDRTTCALRAQMCAVARAVACLNSFADDNSRLEQYDYELRYHAFHSLTHFFTHDGYAGRPRKSNNNNNASDDNDNNDKTAATTARRDDADDDDRSRHQAAQHDNNAVVVQDTVRVERDYGGARDVRLPVDAAAGVPVLCVPALALLASNAVFFLRDAEATLRALSSRLLDAMLGYVARHGDTRVLVTTTSTSCVHDNNNNDNDEAAALTYRVCVLEHIVRVELLSSLRRGVVARDTATRYDHMAAFALLARHYAAEYPSFAALYAHNAERNFYRNVGHVQPRSRLHALAQLRQAASTLRVRDLLRVFVPFLISAVRDYAQGKRALQNVTEGRARGYSDAVLLTIATIAQYLPWAAYHRVLTMLLQHAHANVDVRLPMLRGVVLVLQHMHFLDDDDDDDNNKDSDDKESDKKAMTAARRARIARTLEHDIVPQLYAFLDVRDKHAARKGLRGSEAKHAAQMHSVERVRSELAASMGGDGHNNSSSGANVTLVQLPVAVALAKILVRLDTATCDAHLDGLLDVVIAKLRTKKDAQRESARRVLTAIVHEAGARTLRSVLGKLRDHLVHGYQLHILGYTVVTLLYTLYEPQSALVQQQASSRKSSSGGVRNSSKKKQTANAPTRKRAHDGAATTAPHKRRRTDEDNDNKRDDNDDKRDNNDDDDEVAREEAALLQQLTTQRGGDGSKRNGSDRFHDGVAALTPLLDDLMRIFLDDYLGEIGAQKEQAELASTMREVKTNRALAGFKLLARHADAGVVLDTFVRRLVWLLTPPIDLAHTDNDDDNDNNNAATATAALQGSARARALLAYELKHKYTTVSKGASADLLFTRKVRTLALAMARSLMGNATLDVHAAFVHVRDALSRHSAARDARVRAFESKDGLRRLRGNAHRVLHHAERLTRRQQLERHFLVAAEPARVDVDFSAHTVLATQQKQQLRTHRGPRGRAAEVAAQALVYDKELQHEAQEVTSSSTSYAADVQMSIVLDTVDEFLLRCLLSVLKKVLGIGRDKHRSTVALRLDLLRRQRRRRQQQEQDDEEKHDDDNDSDDNSDGDDDEDAPLQPRKLDDEDDDALERFADAQGDKDNDDERNDDDEEDASAQPSRAPSTTTTNNKAVARRVLPLSVTFTREHHDLLASLLPVVLATLRGEGSDVVVAEALDCLLALVSLRPPLGSVRALAQQLFDAVTALFDRGGAIKQRALRVCASVIAHAHAAALSEAQASQLVLLVRGEVVERSEFAPMALRVLYAVMGRHVHVPELYALVDLITELLVHAAGKAVVRQRCIHVLVRFLTEYKLTPTKFTSHIDLICRNMDYPHVDGRLALLDLLDALLQRLPTVLLRREAATLLLPLAATLTAAEWPACRARAAAVLRRLVHGAGADVVVPQLSTWLSPSQPRPTRTMAAQTWAALLPAVVDLYDIHGRRDRSKRRTDDDGDNNDNDNDDATATAAAEQAALLQAVQWSVPSVLAGCSYEPAQKRKKQQQQQQNEQKKSTKDTATRSGRRVVHKGWTLLYYSLRCAETMLVALPEQLYPLVTPALLPCLRERLLTHAHPWVRAAALRVLRHYCYNYVEQHCHYMRDSADVVGGALARVRDATQVDDNNDDSNDNNDTSSSSLLPLMLPAHHEATTAAAVLSRCEAVFVDAASLLKQLLQHNVATSDVSSERFTAAPALRSPSRQQLLKVLVYSASVMSHTALVILLFARAPQAIARRRHDDDNDDNDDDDGTTATSLQQRAQRVYERVVATQYALLRRQVHMLARPVLRQRSIANYVVRTATLLQSLTAFVAVLPRAVAYTDAATTADVVDDNEETMTTAAHDDNDVVAASPSPSRGEVALCNAAVATLLLTRGVDVLSLTQTTLLPLIDVGLRAGPLSRRVAIIAHDVAEVLRTQLEERRRVLTRRAGSDNDYDDTTTRPRGVRATRRKRTRAAAGIADSDDDDNSTGDDATALLGDVLARLTTSVADVKGQRRVQRITRDTHRQLRRNRREMTAAATTTRTNKTTVRAARHDRGKLRYAPERKRRV